ncbi:MAG TPA: prepilin-type N-terminal cleavage/methylation domain-containing protein [Oscillatoriaceae cyanobacterium M33_DOE_052]|uniref:Prepilin-type N-terminal cleavage/methylation domain-containing protein n=1 Tax=Planktothricoides sp. SpSt-374 TaxID=2282167 RepID=A0A7C3VI93_9CYAN|nr:prepilin-type N-terminal cleavage/methylation domain-containing protein [Oscillatoriaceae cyanobacterium M33_DOE_052]
MKTELKVKFLQHLNEKKREGGFTLIELLVVVIIIGILAAVALPSLLSQANKGKQVEARNNIGALNRAQQAFHLDRQAFTSSIGELGMGIATQTTNYRYEIATGAAGASSVALHRGITIKKALKSYGGYTYTTDVTSGGVTEAATQAKLWEIKAPNPNDGPQATATTVFVVTNLAPTADATQLGN